jgi:dTDP-4-dehydrorhamnose reductase
MYGWPYPGGRDNPVVWWIRSLEAGRVIRVVDNVFSKPLTAAFCARVIWTLAERGRQGVYHAAGGDHVSLYQFAVRTAEIFGLNPGLIEPVPDTFFPEIAPRPRDTSFDTTKIETDLGLQPISLGEGLAQMKAERRWA